MSDQLFTEVSDEQQEAVSGGFTDFLNQLAQFQNFGAGLNATLFNSASGIAAGDAASGPGGSTASGAAGFDTLFSAGLNVGIFGFSSENVEVPPIVPIIPTPPTGPLVP